MKLKPVKEWCQVVHLLFGCDLPEPPFDAESCEAIFKQLDTNGDLELDMGEFERAMKVLSQSASTRAAASEVPAEKEEEERGNNIEESKSWKDLKANVLSEDNSQRLLSRKKNGAKTIDFASWQVLYCGGAAPVVKALNAMHKAHQVDVKIESFNW